MCAFSTIWLLCTFLLVVFSVFVHTHQDPFGDHLKLMMSMIQGFMPSAASTGLREKGTQEYENDVVELHTKG